MKTSQAYSSPPAPAYPAGERTRHTPSLGGSGLLFRSKAAGCLAALFLAGMGSASATDFIRNGDFEGTGGTPDPGYVTGFAPYSPANLYFPWSAFGGTGTGGGFEQPNGVGRIANPFPGVANNSPTVWEDFGNPTYVNTASQNYMADVWLIPGATYHVHAQYYIPSSEVTAGTQPRAGIYLTLFSGGTIRILNPRYPNDPANPASATIPVTNAWHTYDFNWVCPSVDASGNALTGPTRLNYTSFRWYGGDPTLTPDGTNNYGLSQGTHTNPGGYLDNVQISSAAYTGGLSGLVKNSAGPLQDAAVTVSYSGSRFRTDPVNPITPSNGTYSVAGLIPGQVYSITASKAGYTSKTVTATAGSGVPDIILDPVPFATRYEAENAVLAGCTIVTDANASNGFRVSGNDAGGNDTVTFTLNAPAAGLYPMIIGYYQPWDANRNTYLTVNGTALGTIASPQTTNPNYGATTPRNVTLKAGVNTLVLSNGIAYGPHWDYIDIQDSVPSATVSGTVTDSGSPVLGAVIKAAQTANPGSYNLSAPSAADGTYSLMVAVGNEVQLSASTLPAGKQVATAPPAFTPANTSPITGKNITLSNIPGYDPDTLFAMKVESLSGLNPGDPTGNRPTAVPTGGNMVSLGSPTVVAVDGLNWEKNVYATADGYRFVAPDVAGGAYNAPIATPNGISVVAVVQPKYIGVAGEARGEIVDFFYSELFLAVSHSPANEGEVIVDWRGYATENTGYKIPDGQKTVLSLVVQPNGDMKLFANGVQKWSKSTGVDYTSLQQTGLSGGAKTITVGRNDYDGWSIFSGNIGDVYVYKKALDDTALTTLQNGLATKFSITFPPPPNPFDDWVGFYFAPGSPESAMGADPDNDGMNNLQEYAFDGDPTSGANSGHMRTTIEDVGGEKALLLTVAVIDSATFTGSPSLTATAGGVVYTIQGGNDLSGFNQTVTEVTPARSTDMPMPFAGWEYRTFRLSGPISAHPAGFLRVRTAPAP